MTGVLTTGVGRLRLTGDNAGFCEAILRKHNTAAPLRLESLRHVRPREDAAAEQTQQQPLVVNLLMQLRAYYDQNNTFLRSQAALNLQLTNQLRQVLSTSNGAVRAKAGEIERAIRSNLYREGEFSRAMGQLTQELKKNENRPPEWTVDASRSGPAFRASGRPAARTVSGAVSGDRSQTPPALRAFASQETGRETTPVIQPTATVRTPTVPAGERLQYRQEQTPPQVTGNAEVGSGKKHKHPTASQPQPEAPEQSSRKRKRSKQSNPPQKQPEQPIQQQVQSVKPVQSQKQPEQPTQQQAQSVKPVQPQKQPGQSTQQQVQPAKPIPPQKQSEQLIQRQAQLEKPAQSQKQPGQPAQRQSQPEKPVQPQNQPEQPVQPQAQAEKTVLSPKQSEGPTRQQERAEQPARQTERAETPVRQQKPEPVLQPETAPIQMAPHPEHDSRAGSVVSVDHAEPSRISMELSQSSNLEVVNRQTSGMSEESDQTVAEHRQQPVRAVLVSSATQNAPRILPGKWPNASAAEIFWGYQSAAWTSWGRSDWYGSTGLPTTFPGNAQPLRYRSVVDYTAASAEASTQYHQSSMGAVSARIVQPVQYRNILQQTGMLPGTSMQNRQPSTGAVPARIVQSVQYRNILQQAGLLPGIPMQNRQPSTGAVPASIVQPVQYRNILQQAGMLPGVPMQYRQLSTGAVQGSIVQPIQYRNILQQAGMLPGVPMQNRQPSTGAVPARIVQLVQYRNILQQAGMLPGTPIQYRQPSTGAVPARIVQSVQYRNILQQAGLLPSTLTQNRQPSTGAVPARIVQSVQYRNILQQGGLLPGVPIQYRQPSTGAVPTGIVQPVQYRNILQQAGMQPGAPMQNRQPSTGVVPASIVQSVQYRNILQQAGMLPSTPMQNQQPSTGAVPASIVQSVQYRNILQQAGMLPGTPMQNRQPSTGAVPASIVQSVQYRNILQQAGLLPGVPMQYRQPSTGAVPASIVRPVQYRDILQPAGVFRNPHIHNRETATAATFHPTVGGIANRQPGMYGQTLPMLHGIQGGLPQHSGKGMPLIRRAANGGQSGGLLTEGVAAATEELCGAARILSGTAPNGRLSVRQNESDLETVQGRPVAAPTGTGVPFHGLRQLIGRTLRGNEPVQAPELRRAMEVLTNGSTQKTGGTASWSLRRFRTAAAASGSKPSGGSAAGMPTAGATLVSLTPEAISQATGPVWRQEAATPHPTAAPPRATVIHRRPQKPEAPAAPLPVEESSGEEVLKAQTVDAAQVAAMNTAFSYNAESSGSHPAAAPVITPEQEERIAGRVLEELNYNRMAAEVLDRVERRLRAERRKIGR